MTKLAAFAVLGGIGLGVSAATDGWQGVVVFGAGLAGAYVGGRIKGINIFDFRKGGMGGTAKDGEASVSDIIESQDYGPFDRKFNSVDELKAGLNDGDVIFGKRPLSGMSSMGGTAVSDQLNLDVAHEHVFWKENGNLNNAGFSSRGVRPELDLTDTLIQSYRFGPVLHGANLNAIHNIINTYNGVNYNLLGPNCQDFCDAVREGLY